MREDAGATDITVTVEDTTVVATDTYVILGVSNDGLNSRFTIRLTNLRIPAGAKKATGTLTLIPIDDDTAEADLSIVISGTAGADKEVKSATITLIDDDKDSENIHLSVDIVELNRFDDATDIAVTATLDGKVLRQATSFVLTIGAHPDLGAKPNDDTNDDDKIDDADATKGNREAQRDLDYTVKLATLTIPKNSASGTATITITPLGRLPGTIRIASPDNDNDPTNGIQIEEGGLTLEPVDIKIKKEVAATADAITLSQETIREDAGETTIELKVTLTSALVEDETVRLVILSDGEALPFGDTVTGTPTRDAHYKLTFGPPLIIPAGASEGTTTFTLTPIDDTVVAARGAIYIQVTIGDISAIKTIVLTDDDANSTNIALTASRPR